MYTTDKQMLPIGTLLQDGRYQVKRYMGSGGFGNTYEAEQVKLGKPVAVKEFFMRGVNLREGNTVTVSQAENHEDFEMARDKFLKEARRLAHLEESHIVEVSDYFEENGTAYYVMKLINGQSLDKLMEQQGRPFTEQELLPVLRQVLTALKYVHSQQLYHLDIKPANIMQSVDGHVWLIDFGASKQLDSTKGGGLSLSLSMGSGMFYTPGFAAPEQVNGSTKHIGPWTDFYALGATVYNLLTCQRPPASDDITYDGEEAFEFTSVVSQRMRQFIIRLMAPRIDHRPQSAEEVEALLSESVTTPQPTIVHTSTVIASEPTVIHATTASDTTRLATPHDSVETVLRVDEDEARKKAEDDDRLVRFSKSSLFGGEKFGFKDRTTGEVVVPCIWHMAEPFSEGMAVVRDGNRRYGFIDMTGKVVIACKWTQALSFHEGLASVTNDEGRSGYINKDGETVLPFKWFAAGSFGEGLATVKEEMNGKYGFIDRTGRLVIPCQWWIGFGRFSEGLCPVCDWDTHRYGYIDKTGRLVLPYKWFTAKEFENGRARVSEYMGNYYYIDKTGKKIE
ncbi:MAG: WG repeat-containing protein [Prevotella sp.]|nr:WG repeat-containing protein [Prevotella sp.]